MLSINILISLKRLYCGGPKLSSKQTTEFKATINISKRTVKFADEQVVLSWRWQYYRPCTLRGSRNQPDTAAFFSNPCIDSVNFGFSNNFFQFVRVEVKYTQRHLDVTYSKSKIVLKVFIPIRNCCKYYFLHHQRNILKLQ